MKHPWVKYVKVCLNLMTALAVLLLVLFVLPRVLRFFMPFVVGWVIALIANPLVRFLDEKIRIRRKAGSASRASTSCGAATAPCPSAARCPACLVCLSMAIPRTAST